MHGSTCDPLLWVVSMGAHCSNVSEPRGSSRGVCQRDIVNVPTYDSMGGRGGGVTYTWQTSYGNWDPYGRYIYKKEE